MKIKWLERWNSSHAFREALMFPKPKFNDIDFHKWLHKAIWWAHVLFISFYFVHSFLIFIFYLNICFNY